jgi:membrane-bound lytic murein transglycosylase D
MFGLLLLSASPRVLAQGNVLSVEDLVRIGEAWVRDNLDEDLVRALGQVDYDHVRNVLTELDRQLQSQYVIDLAQLRTAAKVTLPLLQRQARTRPYAEWLEARMDYLEVADELRLMHPPPKPKPVPTPKPGVKPPPAPKPPPPPIPSAETERQVWRKHVEKKPLPQRAQPYVPTLKPIFTAAGVPAQLVWLAEIESSFNPEARSPVGAVGLYQLMPKTAEWLGLTVKPKDQRLDPKLNADAAARYLRYLYRKFKNWDLCLAAYNCGEGRVQRLIDRHKTRSFDRLSPHLPAETQMYVPRFEAVLIKREGIPTSKLPPAKA